MKKKNLFLSLALGLSFILLTACASPVAEEDQDLPILDDPLMEEEIIQEEEMNWEEEMPEYDDEMNWEEEMPEYDDEMNWDEEEMEIQIIE